MMTWCVGEGRLERNPIIGNLRLDGDSGRETVIRTPAEYAALFQAMDDLVANGDPPLRPMARAFITVAAWTGMRRSELQRLHWRADRSRRAPDQAHDEQGREAREERTEDEMISLPEPAAEALRAIRFEDALPNDLVFIPYRGEKLSIHRDWIRVPDHAGLPADLVLHGLRHSVGTAGATAGMSAPELQKLLRHRNITTVAKYIHMAETGRFQDRAMGHLLEKPAGEIVTLPKRR